MGQHEAGLLVELVFLRVRDHSDTVRYTRETVWIEILPRRRHADQLGVRAAGTVVGEKGILLANGGSIHSRPGRGKLTLVSLDLGTTRETRKSE